jgi:hypothetical protein
MVKESAAGDSEALVVAASCGVMKKKLAGLMMRGL